MVKAIEIDDVGVRFTGAGGATVQALDGVSGTVPAGGFVSIVGPSGCGKSTLLDVVAGLRRPTTGRALVGDRVVTAPSRDVGVVFQEDSTLPWKTVAGNVAFALKAAGWPKAQRAARIAEMVRLVGLQGFEDAYPATLSGGMRQRVAIARTLALAPSVLLMDEPFGALDPQTRLMVGTEVRRLWQATGTTVLFVTHDINEALLLSEQVWVMAFRPGRVIDVIDVDLDDRRDAAIASTPAFAALAARVWERLRAESVRGFLASTAGPA